MTLSEAWHLSLAIALGVFIASFKVDAFHPTATNHPLRMVLQPLIGAPELSKLCWADTAGTVVGGDDDGKKLVWCIIIPTPQFINGPDSIHCDAAEPPIYINCGLPDEHTRDKQT